MRVSSILLIAMFLTISPACSTPSPPPVVRITANELYKAFQDDEGAATKRFEGKAIEITGEVIDTWAAGPPRAKPSVTFKVDSGGIVDCSGDILVAMGKYEKGARSTVTCPASTLRFSALNNSLQVWDCSAGP